MATRKQSKSKKFGILIGKAAMGLVHTAQAAGRGAKQVGKVAVQTVADTRKGIKEGMQQAA